ncbi:MAG: FAD-binding oxidoreductase [Gemmatimonadetes bacterium]|nr:FAD-binding oxidoreductase [Gemmatimonadota bacterium]
MRPPILEELRGWGGSCHSRSWVYRPQTTAEVAECLADAQTTGLTVAHRGAGLSYGDAALNEGGAVIDMSGLDRILEFDSERGFVRAEAGCTLETIWKTVLPKGWWPPVVPGTMYVTVGGAVAMDVHGKNHWRRGTFGDHVQRMTLLGRSGEQWSLSRHEHPEQLQAAIGTFGLTGTILDVTLSLERVVSGFLSVRSSKCGTIAEIIEMVGRSAEASEYSVGWVDCFSRAGRGIVHTADYLSGGHHLEGKGLAVSEQQLPSRALGLVPKQFIWRLLRVMTNDAGMRALNSMKYWLTAARTSFQSHAAFHFLLDYVPNWKLAYGSAGLIQYQFFIPTDSARGVFKRVLQMQRDAGVMSYLGVVKRHRVGKSSWSYSVDGFSLALDFPAVAKNADRLTVLLREYDVIQAAEGGRIYAAKDSGSVGMLPGARDPAFSSDLARRWEGSLN